MVKKLKERVRTLKNALKSYRTLRDAEGRLGTVKDAEGRLGTVRDAGRFGTQGGRCSIERGRDGDGTATVTAQKR